MLCEGNSEKNVPGETKSDQTDLHLQTMDEQGQHQNMSGNKERNPLNFFEVEHSTTEKSFSIPPLKEYNTNRSTSMQSDWQDKILCCFNYLRENIDPLYLLNKMFDENFLMSGDVTILTKKSRCIKSTQVMIAVARRIKDEVSYTQFKKILSQYHKCCADKLDEPCNLLVQIEYEGHLEHKRMLTKAKTRIEDGLKKLNKEKLLNISSTFVEKKIFDLKDIEEILLCTIAGEVSRTVSVFTELVIAKTEKSSLSCFIRCVEQYKTNNDMILICTTLQTQLSQAQERDATKSRKKELEKMLNKRAVEKIPSDLREQHNLQVTKFRPGSIVIYFKSMNREILHKTDVLHKLFKDGSFVQSVIGLFADNEIKALCSEINVVMIKCDMIAKADKTGDATDLPLDIIEANKSFLIEEIDTRTLVDAFKKRGIECFEHHEIDLNADRKTRATKFLEIVRKENKTKMLMDILKQEEMENILERLQTFQHIFTMDIDSSMLAKALQSKFSELTVSLEYEEIRDVFLERRNVLPKIFDGVDEMCWDMSVAAMLIEILNSGKNSMLTLVELLYLKGHSCLDIAKSVLHKASDSADLGFEETNRKDITNEYYSTQAGTEFSITLKIADIKDIKQQKNSVIKQEQMTVSINEETSNDEQKQTDDASSADELDSGFFSSKGNQEAMMHTSSQYPDGVHFWYVEGINKSKFVIDREGKVVYYNGDVIYSGPCEVIKHPRNTPDGVAYCYEVHGDTVTIYMQSNALNRKNSPNPYEHDSKSH